MRFKKNKQIVNINFDEKEKSVTISVVGGTKEENDALALEVTNDFLCFSKNYKKTKKHAV